MVLFVTGMLVDLSVAIKQVTVFVVIIQQGMHSPLQPGRGEELKTSEKYLLGVRNFYWWWGYIVGRT